MNKNKHWIEICHIHIYILHCWSFTIIHALEPCTYSVSARIQPTRTSFKQSSYQHLFKVNTCFKTIWSSYLSHPSNHYTLVPYTLQPLHKPCGERLISVRRPWSTSSPWLFICSLTITGEMCFPSDNHVCSFHHNILIAVLSFLPCHHDL